MSIRKIILSAVEVFGIVIVRPSNWTEVVEQEASVAGVQIPAHQHARGSLAFLGAMAAQLGTSVEHAAAAAQPADNTEKLEGENQYIAAIVPID